MKKKPFAVFPFTPDAFASLISQGRPLSEGRKRYFAEYFAEIKAKTIIVEHEYIDLDFGEDFANYYAECFTTYGRNCRRLHFFSQEFSEQDLDDLLSGISHRIRDLQKSYLGFIVLKPLPQRFIGRTCIRTYPEVKQRFYPILREYPVSLFGLPLKIKTLAFQEQDKVVAACATSALWSAFHGTGILFHHSIPSPSELTKAASPALSASRAFPNSDGLYTLQMAQAIRSVNLEPLTYETKTGREELLDQLLLKSLLYGYLRGGIPVIMNVKLIDILLPGNHATGSNYQAGRNLFIGLHTVTATGYRFGTRKFSTVDRLRLKADRIERIFAHDDQIGPFAKMSIENEALLWQEGEGQNKSAYALSTFWQGKYQGSVEVKAVPESVLIPLYDKIRLEVFSVVCEIEGFDNFIEQLKRKKPAPPALPPERIEWDVYLIHNNKLKNEILNSTSLSQQQRHEVLSQNLPRFLWRASAWQGNQILLDLLFDSTDIEQGDFLIHVVEYNAVASHILHKLLNTYRTDKVSSWLKSHQGERTKSDELRR